MANAAEKLMSVDEFLAWERNLERYGIPGLRMTRYQTYRGLLATI